MARVVVVSSSEVSRSALEAVVAPDDELVVLVPAVEQTRLQWLANDEDEARERASSVAEEIETEAPSDVVSAQIKPEHPGQVVFDAIARYNPSRVVLAVREGEDASWLEQGALETVPPSVNGVPVIRLAL